MVGMKRPIAFALAILLLAGCGAVSVRESALDRIDTIVVVYAENHSFDILYGLAPGCNGVPNATAGQMTQVDHDGTPLARLPAVYTAGKPDPKYPQGLPNGAFRIDAAPTNARIDQVVPSPIHNYWHNIEQINGGPNNKVVPSGPAGASAAGSLTQLSTRACPLARPATLACPSSRSW